MVNSIRNYMLCFISDIFIGYRRESIFNTKFQLGSRNESYIFIDSFVYNLFTQQSLLADVCITMRISMNYNVILILYCC